VVEFEIEEDVALAALHHAHHLGSRVQEELLADLEGADLGREEVDQALGLHQAGNVEREDEAVPQAGGGAAGHPAPPPPPLPPITAARPARPPGRPPRRPAPRWPRRRSAPSPRRSPAPARAGRR